MKLTGELKEKVEKTETREEATKVIKDAGMELTDKGMELSDDDLDEVAGGAYFCGFSTMQHKR